MVLFNFLVILIFAAAIIAPAIGLPVPTPGYDHTWHSRKRSDTVNVLPGDRNEYSISSPSSSSPSLASPSLASPSLARPSSQEHLIPKQELASPSSSLASPSLASPSLASPSSQEHLIPNQEQASPSSSLGSLSLASPSSQEHPISKKPKVSIWKKIGGVFKKGDKRK